MKKMKQAIRKIGAGMNMDKKLMIVLLSMGLAVSASAQHGHVIVRGGGGYYYHPSHVVVGVGFGYPGFYPYAPYYPYWGYPYPPYYYGNGVMPSKLAMQITDIKADFKAQIKDVRHDKALTHHEKKEKIGQLKQDRDAAIVQARKDFYNSRRNSNQRNGNSQNGNSQNGNSQSGTNQPNKNAPSNNGEDQPEYQEHGPTNNGS
jgi:hypothetical protein